MDKLNLTIKTSDSNLTNLCYKYWDTDDEFKFVYTVSALTQEFEMPKRQILNVVNDNCDAQSTEILCEDCSTPYIYQSRSDFQEKQRHLSHSWSSNEWICLNCSKERKKLEQEEKLERLNQYRKLISERYSGIPNAINPDSITLEDAVYLLSFYRLCASEDFSFAKPITSVFHTRLSPEQNFDYEILRQLYQENIIKAHPNSPIDAFKGENAETFYLDKVFWILPVSVNTETSRDLYTNLEEIFRTGSFPDHWHDKQLDLWKKIALHECLEYLTNSLAEHNLALNPGEKTVTVIFNLLEDYSVAQIFNMIWRSAKDAAAFLVRKGVSKQHASNTVVGAMQRYGETAKIEKWDVKPYRRPHNCPQSMVSQVLFDAVLKIGERGFNITPSQEVLNSTKVKQVE